MIQNRHRYRFYFEVGREFTFSRSLSGELPLPRRRVGSEVKSQKGIGTVLVFFPLWDFSVVQVRATRSDGGEWLFGNVHCISGSSKTATENRHLPGKTSQQHEQFKRLHMCVVARAARAKVDEDATVVLAGDLNLKTNAPRWLAWGKQHAAVISEVAGVSPAASQGADRVPSAAEQLAPGSRSRLEALYEKMRARLESLRVFEENLLKQAARGDAESTAPTAKRPRHEAPIIFVELFVSQRKSLRAQGINV